MLPVFLKLKSYFLNFTNIRFVFKLLLLITFLQLYSCSSTQHATAQVKVSFDVFYNELSPYGRWATHPQQGRVWYPSVHADFSPYGTNGYWAFTDAGWTWISDFQWGWAPFHYGRWFFETSSGWGWVPDVNWSPGWVVWKRAEGFYGWAPIGPGIGIDFAYSSGYAIPNDHWHFIRDHDFGRRDMHNFYVNPSDFKGIIPFSSPINNFHRDGLVHSKYNKGPIREEVERMAGRPLGDIYIQESLKPTQQLDKNRLELYRPTFQRRIHEKNKALKPPVILPPRYKPQRDKLIVPAPKNLQKQNPQYRAIPVTPKTKKEKH